jgi:hypothetical protein
MKEIVAVIFCLTTIGCQSNEPNRKIIGKDTSSENIIMKDSNETCKPLEEFVKFRSNLIDKNVEEVSKVFHFPFKDGNIWHLVYFSSEDPTYDPSITFTMDDFKKHSTKIFNSDFIECLSQVNFDTLIQKGIFETEMITRVIDSITVERYNISSTYDRIDHKVTLVLYYEFYEGEDKYESAINYIFAVKDCNLRLAKIVVAG